MALSPTEALLHDKQQALRLVQAVGEKRTLELLKIAQRGLERRLRTAEGISGPGKGSFTAVQLRTILVQVRAVTAQLQVGMQGVVLDTGKQGAEAAALSAARYLRTAEQRFRGVTQKLTLDTTRLVDRAVAGTESSVLSRLLGEGGPKAQGILKRYGHNVVRHFEDHLQQRLIQKMPLEEVKQHLIASSPFLKEAPASWAERIVRTETAYQEGRASNQLIGDANQQLGDMVKIISCVFDGRTGADSFAVHGQIRRPSESFMSWFGSFQHPPDRPNDRGVVVPHRISWPIPAALLPRGDGEVASRWKAEGRKGGPPSRPLMTTVPLNQFGKAKVENPGSQAPGSKSA